jgi:glycosyltransferase 2 family protein
MYLAWFANCITVARLGDLYRGYLLKRTAGVSLAATLGTVLAERLLDLVILAAMLGAGALVFTEQALPAEAIQALTVGLILSTVGIFGLLSMRRLRWLVERFLPKRLHANYARFEHGTVGSFQRVPLLVAYSAIGWVIEGSTLYLTAAAVGAPISAAGALLVALIASLLTTIPLTPGGLGFTEAGMVLLLQWLGLDALSAGATTLLFRVINYWSIVGFGSVLYAFSARDLVETRSVPSGEGSGRP